MPPRGQSKEPATLAAPVFQDPGTFPSRLHLFVEGRIGRGEDVVKAAGRLPAVRCKGLIVEPLLPL